MRTIVIFMYGDEGVRYYIVDGDQTKFNHHCINLYIEDENKQKELEQLDSELIELIPESMPHLKDFPIEAVLEGAKVIDVAMFP